MHLDEARRIARRLRKARLGIETTERSTHAEWVTLAYVHDTPRGFVVDAFAGARRSFDSYRSKGYSTLGEALDDITAQARADGHDVSFMAPEAMHARIASILVDGALLAAADAVVGSHQGARLERGRNRSSGHQPRPACSGANLR